MSYRKIIGFGESSFVVSLPKEWVVKNGLKKGDDLFVSLDDNLVKISTTNNKNNKRNDKVITIEYTGDKQRFKAELIYAYINDFNLINVLGSNFNKDIVEIRKIINTLAALEVIQQTSNKLVLKDFLNITDISLYDTIRRMDRIVLSMMEDVGNALTGDGIEIFSSLEQKEIDLNKLSNLVFKVLRNALSPADARNVSLNINEVFYYWELALFIEKVGDQLKRIPRHINNRVDNKVIDAYHSLTEQYKLAMKANFTKNVSLALDVISDKGKIFEKLDYCVDKLPRDYVYFLEKMRAMNILCGNIAKTLLKMGLNAPTV